MLTNIAVCDDNQTHLSDLVSMVKGCDVAADAAIVPFTCWKALLQSAQEVVYDVILLDILWEDEPRGISAARELNEISPDSQIIFVTSYLGYATEVYEASHFYLVLKTQLKDRLPAILKKAVTNGVQRQNRLAIKSGHTAQILYFRDILYLERALHQTLLHIRGERLIKTMESLNSLESRLPCDLFLRCHNSFIVNSEQIAKLHRTELQLHSGVMIPVSRRYEQRVQRFFDMALGWEGIRCGKL